MATYRKRGSAWRAEVHKLGVRDSASFNTKAEAIAWATVRESEIIANHGRGNYESSHTLLDAMHKYASEVSTTKRGVRWEKVRLRAFEKTMLEFVGKKVSDVLPDDIAKWRDERLKSVTSGTVRRELTLLSSVFNYAVKEWRWCRDNPTRQIIWPSEPKPRDRRISDKEIEQMLTALNYRKGEAPEQLQQELAIAFLIALETAMRQGEILSLTWDRVFLAERYVHLDATKNGHARDVPLSQRAVELFEKMKRAGNAPCVFRITSASADALFRKARNKAGIEDLHFHDTRHEATTRLARKLDVLDLARMTGHRDPRSLMIYYNATASELASRLD